MIIQGKQYQTVWMDAGRVWMINQLLLPHRFDIVSYGDYKEIARSIKAMIVRGAPAIGATGAYGLAIAALNYSGSDLSEFFLFLKEAKKTLASARPTAYDLFYALDTVEQSIISAKNVDEGKLFAVNSAKEYARQSAEQCKKIGEFGNELIREKSRILTHCNAGALACVDYGTALSPLRFAHHSGKNIFVFVDETRPRLQGALLTAYELAEEGIPHAIIADNAAGYFMRKGEIDAVIVGADRIARNGDVANKIGTYEKAVVAKENRIPFYVAAPTSTFDLHCESGNDIPIEERSAEEVLSLSSGISTLRIAPEKSSARNPSFDITPARFITGIITEKGVIRADETDIEQLFN